MKKKQIFFLEQVENSDCVYIKSHLGKYLTIDGDGKFLGSGDGQGEEEAMIVEPQADGTWAIKSKKCKDPGHPEPISCSANLVLDLQTCAPPPPTRLTRLARPSLPPSLPPSQTAGTAAARARTSPPLSRRLTPPSSGPSTSP